ncbi:Outer membrane receptor proteins, mostly Fe transport [Mucilaginibacter mallensis]|uniref:Outer membrane receptor proteins, mostly Fe transport n=1 Tax=Mucilaginibacter mallensis TaxID=652787 RepID=A0A1H2BXE5_MUCMA|nr:TonB-dependent receptor [Mucilaginibacter mallensis]SDT62589.1 Outer membrane receptor proteins, mostly Fe transport [Mucilaginibacter mallensis]
MKKLLILITILCSINVGMAQNRHTITAIVTDSTGKTPLELTTVVVLKVSDSSMISYTLTDKNGAFTIRLHDNEPARLLISHAGFESMHIPLKYKNAELLNLGTIHLREKQLAEVNIKGELVPVVIKKDTIEFNAEAFKVRPNAVVQDLLKKLPGVQVDRDGTITVNGKGVSKVKVDGRDFFANDPKIATQNLDADMIAKVQIYDDRENDPDHLTPDNEVKKIINLKFKKEFSKATFGKIVAGAGTQDKYNLDGLYNQSINNLQVSVIANSKNLGNTQFIGTSLVGFGPSSGLNQNTNAGVNINDNFGKTVKLNLVYNYANGVYKNQQVTNTAQFLSDTTLTRNTTTQAHSVNNNQSINGNLEWAPNDATKLKYTPELSFGNTNSTNQSVGTSFNNFTPLLSKSNNNSSNDGNNTNYQHSLNYYHSFTKKGESLSITNNVQVSPNTGKNISVDDLQSYTTSLNSDTLNRLANNKAGNTTVGLTADYNYPVSKKITLGIAVDGKHNNTGADLFTYDQNPKTGLYDIFLTSQSTNLTRNEWDEDVHPRVLYMVNGINVNIGFIAQSQQINNQFNMAVPDLDQHFNYLFPSVSINIKQYSFNYSEDVRQPSINQLQPITLVYSPLYSATGNPDLKPTRMRNISFNYNNVNMQSNMYTFLSVRFTWESNSITQETTVSPGGAQTTMPVNKNGRFTTYLNGNISKTFKTEGRWKIRESTNLNGSAGRNFFEVNQRDGYQDTYALPVTQTVVFSYDDVIDFEPSYYINPAITHYELVKYPSVSYVQQTISLPIDVQWPKRINWSINYTHIYNPLVAQGFQRQSNLLSFSIAQAFMQKDKGEIRLTCYDLLNQSVSSYHFASANSIYDIQSSAIRRYFLFTYSYRFSKTKK